VSLFHHLPVWAIVAIIVAALVALKLALGLIRRLLFVGALVAIAGGAFLFLAPSLLGQKEGTHLQQQALASSQAAAGKRCYALVRTAAKHPPKDAVAARRQLHSLSSCAGSYGPELKKQVLRQKSLVERILHSQAVQSRLKSQP
jgi:hypothetical protein